MTRLGRRLGAAIFPFVLLLATLAGCALPQSFGAVPAQHCVSQQRGALGGGGGLVVALSAFDPTAPDHTSALYGVRASDGAVAWSCASSTYAGWDDARLVNGVIYALAGTEPTRDAPAPTHAHGLYAIRPQDGKQLWSYSFQAGAASPLAFDGDLLFFSAVTSDGASSHSNLYAIHTATGALAWAESFGDTIGQPIVVGRQLVVPVFIPNTPGAQSGQELRGLSEADGAALWSDTLPSGAELASWLSLDGTLYYTAGSALTALDGATGKTRWTQPGLPDLSSPLLSAQGAILFSASLSVFAFDQATGAMRWSAVLSSPPGLLGVSADMAYATTQDTDGVADRLYALDLRTGDVRWQRAAPFAASPVADASGDTYFSLSTGPRKLANVVALDSRGALRWTCKSQSPYPATALIPTGGALYFVWQGFQFGEVNAPVITYVTRLRAADGVEQWTTPLAARNTYPLPPMLVV
jgi:outer membrane protein assembly factor BamB